MELDSHLLPAGLKSGLFPTVEHTGHQDMCTSQVHFSLPASRKPPQKQSPGLGQSTIVVKLQIQQDTLERCWGGGAGTGDQRPLEAHGLAQGPLHEHPQVHGRKTGGKASWCDKMGCQYSLKMGRVNITVPVNFPNHPQLPLKSRAPRPSHCVLLLCTQ